MIVENLNWITIPKLSASIGSRVMIRYNHRGVRSIIENYETDKVIVKFSHVERAVAPGQAAVFYDGNKVMGGGFINKSIKKI